MIAENIVLSSQFTWSDIEAPLKSELAYVSEEFEIPSMLLMDGVRPGHLPKFEFSQGCSFFLLRFYDPEDKVADITAQKMTSKLAVYIRGKSVVSIHQRQLLPLRRFTETRASAEFPDHPRALVHQLFRLGVLSLEDALSELQLDYEAFERFVLSKTVGSLSNTKVYEFRRRLYVIKGIVQLTRQSLHSSREFWGEEQTLQQDIRENLDQLYFKLDGVGQSFDQLFALNLSFNEQKNNDVMKVLTVFASVMLPLTFIASFYGMNFDHLPGLHTTRGFVGALLIMATTTFVTIWYFARKRWLSPSV